MTKILLVDDMKHFLNLERSFLQRSDSKILTATTGLEAVKVARKEQPDIILLDVEMPEMNGIEATRILKSLSETRDIPIVIITSLAVREEATRAGADDFQKKPIDVDTFFSLIRKHVDLVVRREERIVTEIPASFVFNDQKWPAVIRDLSRNGCFIKSDFKPSLGDLILVRFGVQLNGDRAKQVQQEAFVARLVSDGFGCSFHDISNGTALCLEEFIRNRNLDSRSAPA